jgi:uncharacterized delta-60 repeat protein
MFNFTQARSASYVNFTRVRGLIIAVAFFICFVPAVKAQSSLDGFDPNANGTVRAVAVQTDGKILIGGSFTAIGGVTRNSIARLNTDGTLDAAFDPNANSAVFSIAVQPDGKILLGGFFTTVAPNGGAPAARNYIARVNADGTLDTTFDPNTNGTVNSVAAQADGKVLLGGSFTTLSPNSGAAVTRNNIARVNTDGTLDTAFDPNANDQVNSIAVQSNGKILFGGQFTAVTPNGGATVTRDRIARVNADGTLDTSFDPNANDMIQAIAVQSDGRIVIGGNFTAVAPNGGASVTRNYIARLNTDGTLDAAFDPNANGVVLSINIQPDGRILFGGNFNTVSPNSGAAVARNRIARANIDGTLDTVFDPNANGTVYSIALQTDGRIVFGGTFTTLAPGGGASVTRNRIARLERDGRLDRTLNLTMFGTAVYTSAIQPDGKIIIGGTFTSVLGTARNNIARLNTDGTLDTGFNPNANGAVYSIALQSDGAVLAGGAFTTIGGASRSRIARLDQTNGLADSFDPNASSLVFSINIQTDGKIVTGGLFTTIGGASRNYIARLDAANGAADSFDPNANAGVYAIAIQTDGKIIVGGAFATIGGQTRNHIARLDATSGAADSFDPNANGAVYTIAIQSNGKIVAGGVFTGANSIGGQARSHIARLDQTSGLADSFDPNANSYVNSIVVQSDGKVLAGGAFTTIGAVTRNRIARLDAANGAADSFDPNSNGTVNAIAMQPDGKVLVGGNFSTIGGQTRSYFARLSNDTAALSNLSVGLYTVKLTRDGSAPQFTRVIFEKSTDNGASWTLLGTATNSFASFGETGKGEKLLAPQAAGYTLNGQSIPTGQNVLIRARGFFRTGYQSGSETIEDKTKNVFLFPPTAANVSISGRLIVGKGVGLTNAVVTLIDAQGNTRSTVSSSFGFYSFDNITVGQNVVIYVSSKRYQFDTQSLWVTEDVGDLNFNAEQSFGEVRMK